MKKLAILLSFFIMFMQVAFAADTTQTMDDNKAVIAVQKQPSNEVQKQKATRNIACIIIQINGKVKDNTDNQPAR